MTPELIAADRIARAVEKGTGTCTEQSMPIGRAAVEYIAAAGLVVLPAARPAELLDANNREVERRRRAVGALRLCLPHLVEAVESLVHCHSTAFDWQRGDEMPADCEPEALVEAEAMLRAITAAEAAIGDGAP